VELIGLLQGRNLIHIFILIQRADRRTKNWKEKIGKKGKEIRGGLRVIYLPASNYGARCQRDEKRRL
jgi:hypothetical protein